MNSSLLLVLVALLFVQSTVAFLNARPMMAGKVLSRAMSMSAGEWPLKTVSKDKMMTLVSEAIAKQLEEVKPEAVTMEASLIDDYDADSVDVVSILLSLEASFKEQLTATKTTLPMDKLSTVVKVEDLVNVMVDVMKEVESKQ